TGHTPKSQFVIAASSADRPNTNAALPSAGLGWGFKPELVEALDQRELLSMTTPHLTGGSKCVWPLRAARPRLDDRWARLGWSAAFADPAFGSIASPPDRLGWRHGAGAVYSINGEDPAARDRGNVVVRPGSRGEGAGGRRWARCSK